jgi:hypothetical protein
MKAPPILVRARMTRKAMKFVMNPETMEKVIHHTPAARKVFLCP